MPTFEHNTLRQYKDQNGDMHLDYPITKSENVVGLYGDAELTGVPTAPTAAAGTNTNQVATTAFVQTEVADIKKELSDGMTLVADAITEKGVTTATDATLEVMAANIRAISSGGELHGAVISARTNDVDPTTISVVLKLGDVTIASKFFDENGVCTFADIQETGSYIVSATRGSNTTSKTISITGDNIVNKTILSMILAFTLDGATATPVNDVVTWLRTNSTGETSLKGYTTLAQVIADTTTLNNLMANKSAMQYLARSTRFADEGCASEIFMTYLGKSPYLKSIVLNSDLWVSKICDSSYVDRVLSELTAAHSDYTSATGTVSATNNGYATFHPYNVFDKDDSTLFNTYGNVSKADYYIQYDFANMCDIYLIKVKLFQNTPSSISMKFLSKSYGSGDYSYISNTLFTAKNETMLDFSFKVKAKNVLSIKYVCSESTTDLLTKFGSYGVNMHEIRLYGK